MDAVDPIDQLNALRRIQQALDVNRNDIAALLELAALQEKEELKRKLLNKILTLDPVNKQAREMLLDLDRAHMNAGYSQLVPIVPSAEASRPASAVSMDDPLKKSRVFIYSIVFQLGVYLLMAFSGYICLSALWQRDWDALPVFGTFLLFLIIPLWYVSVVVKVSASDIKVSRLFGIARWEIPWGEIESVKPAFLGLGIKIIAGGRKPVKLSAQLHGYPALVELLLQNRPDLFGNPGSSTGGKTFEKGFLTKYGLVLLLTPASLTFPVAVLSAQCIPALIIAVILFLLWRFVLHSPYELRIEENRLSTRSFRKKQEWTAEQIKEISLRSTYNRRGIASRYIHLELLNGEKYHLSGFSEGNEIMYGVLKNWWEAYQSG